MEHDKAGRRLKINSRLAGGSSFQSSAGLPPPPLDFCSLAASRFLDLTTHRNPTWLVDVSTCSAWPVKSGQVTKAMAAEGAPPIVVIGTTRDPATPLAWAEALAGQLSSGVLITRDGDGHTGFNQGNECVDDAVHHYLLEGKSPKDGLTC